MRPKRDPAHLSNRWGAAGRGVAGLVGASAGAQLIALLAAPVISRLYGPGDYGNFAVISAAVMALSTVAALRFDAAIPAAHEDAEAHKLLSLGLASSIVWGVIGSIMALVTREILTRYLHLPEAAQPLVVLIPITAGLMGTFLAMNQMAVRLRLYRAIASRNILAASITVGAQVTAGALGAGALGLILGLLLGQAAGVITLSLQLHRHGIPLRPWSVRALKGTARKFSKFPLLLAPSGLINSLGIQAPVLLTSALYGTSVAGWLGMTQRVLAMPLVLFGISVSQVYVGEFSAAMRSNTRDPAEIFVKSSRTLALIGGAIGIALMTLGPIMFASVLGGQWRESGEYARALSVGLAVQMIASPLSQTLILIGKPHYQALWDILRLFAIAGVIILSSSLGNGAQTTLWALGSVSAAAYASLWLVSWRAAKTWSKKMPWPDC